MLLLAVSFVSCSPSRNASDPTSKKQPVAKTPKQGISKEAHKNDFTMKGWTTFRGGERRTGRALVRGPRTPRLKWIFRAQGRIYADAAIADDGTIYVASHDHKLYAVDSNGREIWSYDAGGKIWTSPAIGKDGTVYIGSDEDRLIAIGPKGQEKWTFTTTVLPEKGKKHEDGRWDVDTSPVILADGTIVFGCHYYLYAVNPGGKMRWQFQAGIDRVKIFGSPTLGADGTIYFGTQGDRFFALNQSAKVLWELETGGDNDGTAAVGDDGTVYFGSDDGKIRAVAPGGVLKWEADVGAPIRAALAIGEDGTLFAPTFGKKPFLVAIESKTGAEKWRYHIEPGDGSYYGIQSAPLVDSEGYVYFGGRDHFVYCIDPAGKKVWRYQTGGEVDSGPVLGRDGTLYVGSDDKRLYAFESGNK
jgi:outer membrane protein assembly factor BamB